MELFKELNVLYVEDDLETREGLQRFLKRRAGKVWVAMDGQEGLRQFYDNRPDVLIADLLMPEMNGMELIRQVRLVDRDCRVLITTTVSEMNTVLSAVDLKIDHYIIKPIDTVDLEEKLAAIAEDVRRQRQQSESPPALDKLPNRGELENEMRKAFLSLLKQESGKGAKNVSVSLRGERVLVRANDSWTAIEKTVGAKLQNVAMVEKLRELFYKEITPKIEEALKQASGLELRVTGVHIDGGHCVDEITLTASGRKETPKEYQK